MGQRMIFSGSLILLTAMAFGLGMFRFFDMLNKPWAYILAVAAPFMVLATVQAGLALVRGGIALDRFVQRHQSELENV